MKTGRGDDTGRHGTTRGHVSVPLAAAQLSVSCHLANVRSYMLSTEPKPLALILKPSSLKPKLTRALNRSPHEHTHKHACGRFNAHGILRVV